MTNTFSSRFTTIRDFLATQHWPTSADWKNLFSGSYWRLNPVPSGSPYLLLTTIVIGLILAALIIWYVRLRQLHKRTPIFGLPIDQLPTIIIFVFTISILYAFFRSQQLQYLSSRLMLLASFLLVLGWSSFLIFYIYRVIPAKKRSYLEKERFFRYLPKKRKQ